MADTGGTPMGADRHTSGRTLAEIVREYLAELDNPSPDYTMRNIYRCWMSEMADREEATDGR